MSEHFDVIIIGGGNAGFGASAILNDAGKTIAFIEERDFGGTCPNRGCTPKKVLVAAAHALDEIERAPVHGITVGKPTLDWAKLIDREKDMIGFIPGAMADLAAKRGTVVRGRARFTGPNAVQVGDRALTADNIIIATGSRTRPLPIPGAEHMITSDDVLSERTMPGSVVFIGGGVIAMEFSHVYARAGAAVTILEALPRLLPRMDADAVDAIRAESERIGIAIQTSVTVDAVAPHGDQLAVRYSVDGQSHTVVADRVVNGTGRIANVEGLDLDTAGVAHDGLRIETDAHLRSTSNPAVWAAGDVLTTSAQLSPLATYEGQIVGRNIVALNDFGGPKHAPDYAVIPSSVYTVPALSTVGLTENDATERGLKFAVAVNDMTGWFSGKSYGETVAWAKTLVEVGTDRIIGAHMVGHQGEDLIHLFALAMKHGITASQIKAQVFAFPTFSSDVKNMV